MRGRILKNPGIIIAFVCALALVGVLIYSYATRPRWAGLADKTLWDYLELLIVPAALAIGIYWLNSTQSKRESELEDQRRDREQVVAQTIARDTALQTYLDQMGHLLLDKNLRESHPGDDLRLIARARTLEGIGWVHNPRCFL